MFLSGSGGILVRLIKSVIMAYNEQLVNKVREELAELPLPLVEEKNMFQGLCFMVDEKMCICIRNNTLLCRIGEEQAATELEKDHCRQMINNGRAMKDYVYVDDADTLTPRVLNYWINLCLDFNKEAKPAKRKKRE